MSDMVLQKNPAALFTPRVAAWSTATAGGSGNNTAVTGVTIQRSLIDMPMSAAIMIRSRAVLAAAATLTLKTIVVNDSADGSTWASFLTFTDPGVVSTGPGGGGTVDTITVLNAALKGARDYVQLLYTPNLSASGTDTLTVDAFWIFAGEDRLPAAL